MRVAVPQSLHSGIDDILGSGKRAVADLQLDHVLALCDQFLGDGQHGECGLDFDPNQTQAINMVVVALDRLDDLSPVVAALGRRHADYGVTDAHYDTVGAALIWTLEKGLGELWSEDAKAAWLAAYTVLADIMKSAAADIDDSQTARHASGVAV